MSETELLHLRRAIAATGRTLLRTRHLACFVLLLSTLCAAPPQASVQSAMCCEHAIAMLLQHGAARNHVPSSFNTAPVVAAASKLPLASLRTIWTVRPPSAHSMTVHAVTGLAPSALL